MKQASGSQTAHLASALVRTSRVRELAHRTEPALKGAKDAAHMLGVSVRKFHSMRADVPAPVVLGARAVRWRTADLRTYVENLVGVDNRPEPQQLAVARAKKANPNPVGAPAVEGEATGSGNEHRRGVGRRPVQSNPENGIGAAPDGGNEGPKS